MTTGSLEITTIIVLFTLVCIFANIGLSVWVVRLRNQLKQYEGSGSHGVNSNIRSLVYEVKQSTSAQPPKSLTLKVLSDNVSSLDSPSPTLSTDSTCGHGGARIVLVASRHHHEHNQSSEQTSHFNSSIG